MKKKLLFFVLFVVAPNMGFAQVVENFEVGPYEVEYKGAGDYRFRLRKGIDLYDFFELKRDTVFLKEEVASTMLKNGIQITAMMETTLSNKSRYSNAFGISGSWKQCVSKSVFVNGGVSLELLSSTAGIQKYNMMELGVPLSVELCGISKDKSSLYGGIGVVPTFYSTMSSKYDPEIQGTAPNKYSGLLIAPQIDFGGYVPIDNLIVRLGIFMKYRINCSTKDYNLYKQLLGNTFFGANLGVVF